MRIADVDFPDQLLLAFKSGDVVVFAGAGVSMGHPACLPSFAELTDCVATHTNKKKLESDPIDIFLGRLKQDGVEVHKLAARQLAGDQPTDLHRTLLRLFRRVDEVRLVTTNFDRLFEMAASEVFGAKPEIFCAPALPLGNDFTGLVHVHGSIAAPRQMVLTDADFGRAYLTKGWVRRFIVDLFQKYTVLFVGYSHEDVVLNYLARALPPATVKSRFALVGSKKDDTARWERLGVTPVIYPQTAATDHNRLPMVLEKLAGLMRQGVMDWRREIREMASALPPIDKESNDRLAHALGETSNVRFFTETAALPEWVEWLEKREFLDALFDESKYDEKDWFLARWLVQKFGADHSGILFALFARNGNRLVADLWQRVYFWLVDKKNNDLDDALLAQWISLLLDTTPDLPDVDAHVVELAVRCGQLGRHTDLVGVLHSFLEPRICSLGQVQSSRVLGIATMDQHYFDQLWKQCCQPLLGELAEAALECVASLLERRYHLLETWQDGSGRDMVGRAAIEDHEQNFAMSPSDMVIDVVRDSLDWLGTHNDQAAGYWCDRLIRSRSPLLGRLAVHGVSARRGFTADERIEWLLANTDLHDHDLHHEMFRLAKGAYAGAADDRRSRFVDRILGCHSSACGENGAMIAAYKKLHWLVWLEDVAPDCERVRRPLKKLRVEFPNLEIREHPDFTMWTSGVKEGALLRSRWPADELLACEPKEWVSKLPDSLPDFEIKADGSMVDRASGLARELENAAVRRPRWALDVASELLVADRLDEKLWPALVCGLGKTEGAVVNDVLALFNHPELQREHGREIARALWSALDEERLPWAGDLLPRLLDIAVSVMKVAGSVDTVDLERVKKEGWAQVAVGNTADSCALIFLRTLDLLHRQDRAHDNDVAYRTVRKALATLVADATDSGAMGVAILAGSLRFLLAREEGWTRAELLPLFCVATADSEKAALHEAVWDGFLLSSRLDPVVAEAMTPLFVDVTPSWASFADRKREKFMYNTIVLMVHFEQNPLEKWIPLFFEQLDEESRAHFATGIDRLLLRSSPEVVLECWRRWLKRYWMNRLDGVPCPLCPCEIAVMFRWLCRLQPVFAEAVDVAVRMPVPEKEKRLPPIGLRILCEALPVSEQAEVAAKLILRLDEFQLAPGDNDELQQMLGELARTQLPEKTKRRLVAVAARRGADVQDLVDQCAGDAT